MATRWCDRAHQPDPGRCTAELRAGCCLPCSRWVTIEDCVGRRHGRPWRCWPPPATRQQEGGRFSRLLPAAGVPSRRRVSGLVKPEELELSCGRTARKPSIWQLVRFAHTGEQPLDRAWLCGDSDELHAGAASAADEDIHTPRPLHQRRPRRARAWLSVWLRLRYYRF